MPGLTRYEPEKLVLGGRTEKPDDDKAPERLVIFGIYMGTQWQFLRVAFTSRNAPPRIESGISDTLIDSQTARGVDLFNYNLLWAPASSATVDTNSLRESGRELVVNIEQPAGAANSSIHETLLTKAPKLADGFRVRPIMHAVENPWEAPLFYSDEHSVFFVSADEQVGSSIDNDDYFVTLTPPGKLEVPPLIPDPIFDDPKDHVTYPLGRVELLGGPNLEQVLATDKRFVYDGVELGAAGISTKGEV